MCDRCKHAGSVGGYPDGQDMFVCESDDPRVPFDMEEDTVCPVFELRGYEYNDWLLDKAIVMMHDNLPAGFIDFIDDDLHNRIVCAFENYIDAKGLFMEDKDRPKKEE